MSGTPNHGGKAVRVWLGRAAIVGWLALGAFAATLAPEPEPMSPDVADRLFGEIRSAQSSAPAGLLAFADVLRRLDYQVSLHHSPRAPDADVLVLLEPATDLEFAEIDELIAWIAGGGRLVYAPKVASIDAGPEDNSGKKGEGTQNDPEAAGEMDADTAAEAEPATTANPMADGETTDSESDAAGSRADSEEAKEKLAADAAIVPRLLEALEARAGSGAAEVLGTATLFRVGDGQVALLPAGGAALSNEALAEAGLAEQLGWLHRVLDGAHRVAFDEGRIGMGSDVGFLTVLGESPFAPGLKIALAALLLLAIARGVRRSPPQAEPPAGGRSFAEYLDALALLLHGGGRLAIARTSVLGGTRRRLGGLARTEAATQTLARVEQRLSGQPSAAAITRGVEALRRLEEELLGGR